jgi:hypothetical protein
MAAATSNQGINAGQIALQMTELLLDALLMLLIRGRFV